MKFVSSAASLVLILLQINNHLTSSTEVVEDEVLNPNIATEGFGPTFLKAKYRDGVTYLETSMIDQTTNTQLGEQDLGDSTMLMVAESKIAVSDMEGGGKRVEISYDHIGVQMEMMGQTQEYDSNMPNEDSPFDALLDHSITLEIDDEGTVVSASENEELLQSLSATTGGNSPATDLASSKRFDQMARMAKTLPEYDVMPGDDWRFEYSDGEMVGFEGDARFLGFTDHNGHSCAVVTMRGDIDLNFGELSELLGEDEPEDEEGDGLGDYVAAMMQNVKVSDGRMEATLYFDNEENFVRWMKMAMTMEMTVPMGEDELLMNIEQVMKVSTRTEGE